MKVIKICLILDIFLIIGILILNHYQIHDNQIEAVMTDKYKKNNTYYIEAKEKQIVVDDSNLWTILKENKKYNISYMWLADSEFILTDIKYAE